MIEVDQDTRRVTLTTGSGEWFGRLSFDSKRICWGSGAVWAKTDSDKDFASEQPNLLSDQQLEVVVDRVNQAVDIWGLPEAAERQIFERPAQLANENLKDAMRSFMAEDWVNAV